MAKTVRELLQEFTQHFVKCKDCKITQACPEGVRLRRIYDDAFEAALSPKAMGKGWKKPDTPPAPPPTIGASIWVVTFNEAAFPGKYVVRQHFIEATAPQDNPFVVDGLAAARACIPEAHTHVAPEPGDDATIVESWVPDELLRG